MSKLFTRAGALLLAAAAAGYVVSMRANAEGRPEGSGAQTGGAPAAGAQAKDNPLLAEWAGPF